MVFNALKLIVRMRTISRIMSPQLTAIHKTALKEEKDERQHLQTKTFFCNDSFFKYFKQYILQIFFYQTVYFIDALTK